MWIHKFFQALLVKSGCDCLNHQSSITKHYSGCKFVDAAKEIYKQGKKDGKKYRKKNDDDDDDDKNSKPSKSDDSKGMASVDDPALSDKLVDASKQTTNYENYKREQLDTLIKRYDSIKYSDQEIAGVIYAWKNINVNIGAESRLNLTGAMVAYGREPNKDQDAQKTTDTGNINYNAKSVDLTFDPSYLNKLLDASAKRKLQIKMFANY